MACLRVRLPDEAAACLSEVDRFLAKEPGERIALQAKLRLALRFAWPGALGQAWQALLGTESQVIAKAGPRLAELLKGPGQPDPRALCLALAQSRLYPEAGWVASRFPPEVATAEIRAYADYLG